MQRIPTPPRAATVAAPITITKTVSATRPPIGSNITFTILVANTGTAVAHDVVVTEVLPAGYLLVSATASVGSYASGIWTVGDMAIAAIDSLEIVATVLADGPYANAAGVEYKVPGEPKQASADIASEATPAIPAGSDGWYDAPTASVIPFAAHSDAVSELTVATAFGADDDFAAEEDLPGLLVVPVASAWWQLTVPASVSDVLLTVDTWLTIGGRLDWAGGTDTAYYYPGDTNLSIWTTAEAPPLGELPTDDTDFDTLELVDQNDDSPDPADPTREYTSRLVNVPLTAGKVYWIRVDTWGGEEAEGGGMYADGLTYRLRVSLSFTA